MLTQTPDVCRPQMTSLSDVRVPFPRHSTLAADIGKTGVALRFLPPGFCAGSLRPAPSPPSSVLLLCRRSNSISKSPGPSSPKEPLLLSRDISRSESLRCSSSCSQQIFRPCDLIHGEVLGKGFFGQAIKVSAAAPCCPQAVAPASGDFSSPALPGHLKAALLLV